MCSSVSKDKDSTTPTSSPADELFYKGKLLPLHLPPRLLMVQNLLQISKTEDPFINKISAATTTTTTNTSTPLGSCNESPSESYRVSSFFEWPNEMTGFIVDHSKKPWTRKLQQIKKSSLGQKIKASRAYLMSLFSKSTSSDEFCAKAACKLEEESISKGSDGLNKHIKVAASHRKSFSGAIQRHSPMKCSSLSGSSFSFSSIGFYNLQLLKRSSSANSEIESSIEGAIAYCKQSQSQSQ